eukprot:157976_1
MANFKFSTPINEEKNLYRWQHEFFGEGGCRYAYAGRINKGDRKGDHIVVKKWIDRHIFDKKFWNQEIATHKKAKELIDAWNDENFIDKKYVTHVPFLIQCVKSDGSNSGKSPVVNEWLLGEDYISGYFQKWNSNSGYVDASSASIQAFCHWTYDYSGGELLMCDAQGVRGARKYQITDPCICSKGQKYGLTDMGTSSINSFFANHKCNDFCESNWDKPAYIDYSDILPKRKTSTYRFHKTKPSYGLSNDFSKLSIVHE